MTKKTQEIIRDYVMLIVGTAMLAFSLTCIYDQIGLVIGGFTGLAIVVKEVTKTVIPGGIPLWITNLVLNVPLFLWGIIRLGKKFVGRTVIGTLLLSFWLYVIPSYDVIAGDYTIAAVFGGTLAGIGMGLILRARATTGGTDMVATLLHTHIKHYSIVRIMQVLDGIIVILGFFVFGLHPTLYAIVAIFITAKASDLIMEGFKYSKAAYIITSKTEEVTQALLEDLDRGVTGLHATGMYTGKDRCVLLCVVSKKEIVFLKELVVHIDPEAFVIVSDVREVMGEGFLEYIDLK